MRQNGSFQFGPFRFDPLNRQLWREKQSIQLRPKPLAVLHYFLLHPERLIPRQELFEQVWPETTVSATTLHVCIRELRRALGETIQASQFIETVGQQGYRFRKSVQHQPSSVSSARISPQSLNSSILVGRQAELQQLQHSATQAAVGTRQIIFVIGEPGAGKTMLVDRFLTGLSSTWWLGRGQCAEHYGSGEAYLPVLEALSQLGRAQDGEQLVGVLQRYAPTWLGQLPALISQAELETLQRKTQGSSHARMLREFADALDAFTAERELTLVFEDLHWSDKATLELMAYIAQRRQPARLMLVGTHRPTQGLEAHHPLRGVIQELQGRGQSTQLRVGPLSMEHVATYVASWLGTGRLTTELAERIHHRTEGNPLFMANMLGYCLRQELVRHSNGQWEFDTEAIALEQVIPDKLQGLIDKQIQDLDKPAQHALLAASVVGSEFCAATVAAGLKQEAQQIEAVCDTLVEQGLFLRSHGLTHWPDGTVSAQYGFIHALYQEVLYQKIPAGQQVQLHRQTATWLATAYGRERSHEIASELALHYERGRDYERAVTYHHHAGQQAVRHSAYHEAIGHLGTGIALLAQLPSAPEHVQRELGLQTTLGMALVATQGYTAPAVKHCYQRAQQLCQQVGETPQLFPVLAGICQFYLVRGEMQTAAPFAEQLLHLAHSTQETALLVEAHELLGNILFWQGELGPASIHLVQSLSLYDSALRDQLAFLGGADPKVSALCYRSPTLWMQGYPDQAAMHSAEALAWAQDLSHPFSLTFAHVFSIFPRQFCWEWQATHTQAEAATALASEHDFPLWGAIGKIMRGWVLTKQDPAYAGLTEMRQGMGALQAMGTGLARTYFSGLLAEAYSRAGQAETGLGVVKDALADAERRGERMYEAELYRLKGEGLLAQEIKSQKPVLSKVEGSKVKGHKWEEAEECFVKAIEIAQRQEARSWELRATLSLSRLWHQQGKTQAAQQRLSAIYDWFSEGFDTADLQEARQLLTQLAAASA